MNPPELAAEIAILDAESRGEAKIVACVCNPRSKKSVRGALAERGLPDARLLTDERIPVSKFFVVNMKKEDRGGWKDQAR